MGFLGFLIILVCVVLCLIVLIQNSKGGGLTSNFSSSAQILGVAKTKDILEQITWGAAGVLLLLCLLSTPKMGNSKSADGKKEIPKSETAKMAKAPAGSMTPGQPAGTPQTQPTK